jgi:hypothetical protein
MTNLTKESTVKLGSKEIKVADILETIIYLPVEQVKSFFLEINLTIPRELRINILKDILRDRVVETRKQRVTLADELNYRLSWFHEFTETQLENLLLFYDDYELNQLFFERFWTDLIAYMMDKGVAPKNLERLYKMSVKHAKDEGLDLPDVIPYNRHLESIVFDRQDRIDGLTQKKIRPVLYKSSTLTEIRQLGLKYGVKVPKRLKKSELAEIIVEKLKERGEHTEALEKEIRGMSVLVMQRFAIDHKILASTELKKAEIIEYILANAEETKESYFVPEGRAEYEQEIIQAHEEPEIVTEEIIVEEEIIEEPVVEEDIIPVETDVEEERDDLHVHTTVDLTELTSEVRRLREVVETLLEDDFEEPEPRKPIVEGQERIVLNSAEVYGDVKKMKRMLKKDEAEEREAFIEEQKESSSIGTGVEHRDGERNKKKKKNGKKIALFLLKWLIIVLVVLFILLFFYAIFSEALEDTINLDSVDNAINKIPIFGKGLLDRMKDFTSLVLPGV